MSAATDAIRKALRLCRNDGKPCGYGCNGDQCMTDEEAEEYYRAMGDAAAEEYLGSEGEL